MYIYIYMEVRARARRQSKEGRAIVRLKSRIYLGCESGHDNGGGCRQDEKQHHNTVLDAHAPQEVPLVI